MKYKIGDIVTIKRYREGCEEDYPFSFTDFMLAVYGGKKLVINRIEQIDGLKNCESLSNQKLIEDNHVYSMADDEYDFTWHSSMFEEDKKDINIF